MTSLDFIDKSLTIKSPPDFTVVSTFSGCGGSSTGYVWAGGKVLLAVEWDDNAVDTYRTNYPDTPIYHGDIAKLSVDDCLQLMGLDRGDLDILDGSPPCQGFSTAGKRVMNDPRNQLFQEYVRLLEGLQPKTFVMENVSGMIKGKMKLIFVDILKALKLCGYQVSARLLNAKYFGVPQSRERLIFIGVRNDLRIQPSHPKAQTQIITVSEAITGVSINQMDLCECQLTDLYTQYWHQTKQGQTIGKLNQNIKLHLYKPSKTLQKSEGNGGVYHPLECRSMTRTELMRLGSFPDSFQFSGSRRNVVSRIGNSVPPRFMQAIAEHIRDTILFKARSQALSSSTHEITF